MTNHALVDRLATEAQAEIKAMADSARRSIGQRYRYSLERIYNGGSVKPRTKKESP